MGWSQTSRHPVYIWSRVNFLCLFFFFPVLWFPKFGKKIKTISFVEFTLYKQKFPKFSNFFWGTKVHRKLESLVNKIVWYIYIYIYIYENLEFRGNTNLVRCKSKCMNSLSHSYNENISARKLESLIFIYMEEHFQQIFALRKFVDMMGYGQPVVGATITLCDTKGIYSKT